MASTAKKAEFLDPASSPAAQTFGKTSNDVGETKSQATLNEKRRHMNDGQSMKSGGTNKTNRNRELKQWLKEYEQAHDKLPDGAQILEIINSN